MLAQISRSKNGQDFVQFYNDKGVFIGSALGHVLLDEINGQKMVGIEGRDSNMVIHIDKIMDMREPEYLYANCPLVEVRVPCPAKE